MIIMCAHSAQSEKEVVVMDADGSKSSDDSIPLGFSEPRLVLDDGLRVRFCDHLRSSLFCR